MTSLPVTDVAAFTSWTRRKATLFLFPVAVLLAGATEVPEQSALGAFDPTPTLGSYPDTSVPLSGDTTVTPDATPTNTTKINVSTNTNFNGTFAASPTTGIVMVTDAHPAGTYTVAVTAFGPGGTTTKTFTLTVTSTPCGAGLTAGFSSAADVDAAFAASVAIGDFNGDGIQDLAVADADPFSGAISIRLGNGLGGFSGSTEVSMGAYPISVAIGDFNSDGKQDLAVAHLLSGAVSIRLGDGLGGFSGSTEVSVGSGAFSVAIGDFNGDGRQDLAVGHYGSSPTVSIRLGDGLGGFSGSAEVSVGSGSHSVAIGDFNGDGKQDLAVANAVSNTVSIRLGDGLGGFSGSADVSVGSSPSSVAIGDFNGDGEQDLAVANAVSYTVSIRLGDGLGGFSGSADVSVGSYPRSIAIGDFNGDGKQDLAVPNGDFGTVSIRLGDGLGGFSGSTEVSVGYEPESIAIGDFNGDGKQDLAVASIGSNTVSIRLGQCIPPAAQALNLSTRMLVQTDDNVGIGGFIITGSAPKQVLLRGIGPSLTGSGLPDALADPVMELHGPAGFTTIINDSWMDTQAAAILGTGLAPTNNLESAILVTLNPGPYTAIVKGKNNTVGVALVELYDLDQAADSKLANISTRAFVNTGANLVIAGFILGGNSGSDNIVVRGIGPSLTAFGVPSVLANPTLELRNSNGALLVSNDDWQDDPVQAAIITAAGLAPSSALESAIAATLSPGQYTAILAGANSTTGNGVVEVYDLGTGAPVPTPTPGGGTATPTATATATP